MTDVQDRRDSGNIRHRRKRKIALAVLAIFVVGFFATFNTSTRYGRWLYWRESDCDDMNRFPWRTVANDPVSITALGTKPDPRVMQVVADFRIDGQSIREFAASHESTAMIILHNGHIVFEEYFQGHNRDSLQSSFSCTKSVVSLLVGIALADGLIGSVEEPISKFVDGLDPAFESVSIRQLLTMTSGLSSQDDKKLFDVVPAPWSDEVKAYYDPNCRRLARTFQLDYDPGERFEYHDYSPILVGMMLEQVTGRSLTDYLSDKLWRPAGMEYPARWSLDSARHGFEKPEAGLHVRAIDFARLGRLLLNANQAVVSQDWLQAATVDTETSQLLQKRLAGSAQRAFERGNEARATHIRSMRYGYYWWGVQRAGRYDYYANGHFGQFLYVSPSARLVIVRHGVGHGGLDDWDFANQFFELASAVIAAAANETKPTHVSEAYYDGYSTIAIISCLPLCPENDRVCIDGLDLTATSWQACVCESGCHHALFRF